MSGTATRSANAVKIFDRFRPEQIGELIEFFRKESERASQEVIDAVKAENFTLASMKCGELELCKLMVSRGEKHLKNRRDEHE